MTKERCLSLDLIVCWLGAVLFVFFDAEPFLRRSRSFFSSVLKNILVTSLACLYVFDLLMGSNTESNSALNERLDRMNLDRVGYTKAIGHSQRLLKFNIVTKTVLVNRGIYPYKAISIRLFGFIPLYKTVEIIQGRDLD